MSLTSIPWADFTYNPWIGCSKVSEGCARCYAEARDKRHMQEKVDHWGKGAPRYRTSEATRSAPYRWNKRPLICEECNDAISESDKLNHWAKFHSSPMSNRPPRFHRARVFLGSLMDIF